MKILFICFLLSLFFLSCDKPLDDESFIFPETENINFDIDTIFVNQNYSIDTFCLNTYVSDTLIKLFSFTITDENDYLIYKRLNYFDSFEKLENFNFIIDENEYQSYLKLNNSELLFIQIRLSNNYYEDEYYINYLNSTLPISL